MEVLYKKLYDKYTTLKTKKLAELDHLNKDQEVKFMNYVSAAEELIQHMKSENDKLRLQVNELRGEVASVRSNIDAKSADYQKQLMEANQKNNTLFEEVEKLRQLQQEGNFGGLNNGRSNEHLVPSDSDNAPGEASRGSSGRNMRKRSKNAASESVELSVLNSSAQDDTMLRQSTRELSQKALSSGAADVQQLECCRRNVDQSDDREDKSVSTSCPYRCLVEHLMGMELSTSNQDEGMCISAVHKSSGYSFSLTWVNNKLAGDVEILYRVLSLGAFERVAPEWMKEAIMFSTSMCPMFFEKHEEMAQWLEEQAR